MAPFSPSSTVIKSFLHTFDSWLEERKHAADVPNLMALNDTKSKWKTELQSVAGSLRRILRSPKNTLDSPTTTVAKNGGDALSLPDEILLDVFAYFRDTREHLKSSRLVCRAWAGPATEILFNRVVVSPHAQNILVLQKIIHHPTFPHFVKEIVYDASAFAHFPDKESYRAELNESLCGEKKTCTVSVSSGLSGYAKHCQWEKCDNYYTEGWQKYLKAYGEQVSTPPFNTCYLLDQCLGAFPHIETILVQSSWSCEWGPKGITRFTGPGFLARTWDSRVLCPKPVSPDSLENNRANWPLAVVARAFQKHGRLIKNLVFEERSNDVNTLNWAMQRNYQDLQDSIKTPLMHLVSGLEVLALSCPSQIEASFNQLYRSNQALGQILTCAHSLRYLELTDWSMKSNTACLLHLIAPNLNRFALMGGTFSPEELMYFLFNHSQTLKELDLLAVAVNGHWAPLLDFIHDHMLSLEDVRFLDYPREWRQGRRRTPIQILLMPPINMFLKSSRGAYKWYPSAASLENYCLRRTETNWLNGTGLRVRHCAPVRFTKLHREKIFSGAKATKLLSLPRARHL